MQKSNFGQKLIEHRKENGLTQEELAEKCNITSRTIQRIETGAVNPRAFTIKKISEALGFDFYESTKNIDVDKNAQVKPKIKMKILTYLKDLFNLKSNTMKKVTILSSLTILFVLTFAIVIKSYAQFNKNKLLREFESNFIKVNDTLYVDKYELTNAKYKTFLRDLTENKKHDLCEICKYDSSQWKLKIPKGDHLVLKRYYYDPVFNHYPIVNISLNAANEYCKWLTDKYHSSKNRKYKKVKFRLPSEKEWLTISNPLPGNRLPWYGNSPYDPESLKSKDDIKSLTNVKILDKVTGQTLYGFDGGIYTLPVGVYQANSTGVYDIIGNVSEMTLDGKIKGGSFDNYIEDCYIDVSQDFVAPDPRVGFRITMVVLEN